MSVAESHREAVMGAAAEAVAREATEVLLAVALPATDWFKRAVRAKLMAPVTRPAFHVLFADEVGVAELYCPEEHMEEPAATCSCLA